MAPSMDRVGAEAPTERLSARFGMLEKLGHLRYQSKRPLDCLRLDDDGVANKHISSGIDTND
jgi:hypothetical protein